MAISNADREIERRVTSLNNLITRIQSMKKITDSQKASFVTQIQTQITNLNNLKVKIDADTDLAVLKEDKQSILTEYRVYMLFIPKLRIIAAADRILEISDDITSLLTKVQTVINTAQQNGRDVTTINSIISEIQTQITDAKTQAQNAIDTVSSLTPDLGDKNIVASNTSALKSAREMLRGAVQDINTARFDIQKIRLILIGFRKTGNTASPSATPVRNY
jgi:NADH dehydrogenase/NADH:ubiquinone oxidoreductase subunit G